METTRLDEPSRGGGTRRGGGEGGVVGTGGTRGSGTCTVEVKLSARNSNFEENASCLE